MWIRYCLILLFLASPAWSADFYVDNQLVSDCTGGDYSIANRNCTGSDGNGYDTVAEGVTNTSEGDTLNIRAGTYTENDITISWNGPSMTTIQAYNGESVTIHNDHEATNTGAGTCGDNADGVETFNTSSADDVTFKDLILTGSIGSYNEEYNSVAIGGPSAGSGYIIVDNCEISGFNHVALKGGHRWWVKNSYIHDIGVTSGDHGVYSDYNGSVDRAIIEHTFFENIVGAGIQLYGGGNGDYWIIRNNIFLNCGANYNGPICSGGGSGWGIIIEGSDNDIYGNTFYGCNRAIDFFRSTSSNNEAKNNIFYNNTTGVACDQGGGIGNVVSYNTFGSNSTDIQTCNDVTDSNNTTGINNPFVETTFNSFDDFRLDSGATSCIDAGTNLGPDHDDGLDPNDTTWPPSTLDQDSYGDGWEIGAFVYDAGESPAATVTIQGGGSRRMQGGGSLTLQ